MNTIPLPDKLYFRIGEVCELVGVKPHVLRYWETEFRQIRPSKTSGGLRLYSRRDIEIILEIKYLLYEKGYTIAGAKKALATRPARETTAGESDIAERLLNELKAIRDLLGGNE